MTSRSSNRRRRQVALATWACPQGWTSRRRADSVPLAGRERPLRGRSRRIGGSMPSRTGVIMSIIGALVTASVPATADSPSPVPTPAIRVVVNSCRTADRSCPAGLFIAGVDGVLHGLLANEAGEQLHPDWTPDGAALVYEQTTGEAISPYITPSDVRLAPVDGGESPRVVAACTGPPCAMLQTPAVSPDGTQVAYVRNDVKDALIVRTAIESTGGSRDDGAIALPPRAGARTIGVREPRRARARKVLAVAGGERTVLRPWTSASTLSDGRGLRTSSTEPGITMLADTREAGRGRADRGPILLGALSPCIVQSPGEESRCSRRRLPLASLAVSLLGAGALVGCTGVRAEDAGQAGAAPTSASRGPAQAPPPIGLVLDAARWPGSRRPSCLNPIPSGEYDACFLVMDSETRACSIGSSPWPRRARGRAVCTTACGASPRSHGNCGDLAGGVQRMGGPGRA